MLCENCHKNEACIHMTQIINGEKTVRNLCAECAGLKEMEEQISFQNIFQGLLNMAGLAAAKEDMEEESEKVATGPECSQCHMTYNEFVNSGKLGCDKCYHVFQSNLNVALRNMQAGIRHTGKIPQRGGVAFIEKRQIELLRQQLTEAIGKEAYEEAARLRDEIRALQKEE